jgi:hypothetical protein
MTGASAGNRGCGDVVLAAQCAGKDPSNGVANGVAVSACSVGVSSDCGWCVGEPRIVEVTQLVSKRAAVTASTAENLDIRLAAYIVLSLQLDSTRDPLCRQFATGCLTHKAWGNGLLATPYPEQEKQNYPYSLGSQLSPTAV